MQFAQELTGRQAAEAVRSRRDWKYALGLEITDSGFDYSVFSEGRSRLIAAGRESQLLDKMLAHFQDRDGSKPGVKPELTPLMSSEPSAK
jgi:transposase